MNIGVIGYGYWGPNLVRNFSEVPDAQVVAVSDLDEQRLGLVKARYPAIAITTDHETLLSNRDIDAIVIATPVASHYAIALQALSLKKHVFIEKPLTQTAAQGQRLIEEADKHNLTLHVDHTFVYTGAVRKIRALVGDGEVGGLYYFDSVRVSLGIVSTRRERHLGPRAARPFDNGLSVSVARSRFPPSADVMSGRAGQHCLLDSFFENDAIAHLHVNWLAPVKIRRTLIGGNRKMIIYDDLEPSEKVKVYDKGITVNGCKESMYDVMIGYRTGDVWAPKLEVTEAIFAEARYFIRCITHGERSITDGRAGLRVVRILEAATNPWIRAAGP